MSEGGFADAGDRLDRCWAITVGKTLRRFAQRPILHEGLRQLNDRMTRYDPLYLKVFPTPESRPRQRETLIEIYRNGKITEAFRAFRKIYLEVVDQLIDHLKSQEAGNSSARS